MPRPTLYAAITNHGFGHATRTAAVLAEIQHQYPEVLLILATGTPRWLLDLYLPVDFIYRPCTFDIGAIQSHGFHIDKNATLQKLQQIQARERKLIAAEATFVQQNQVDLILGDIPPLIAKVAEAANIPCWMSSNFGWDLIYQEWGEEFADIVEWVQDCFSRCDRLFRLPFHEAMPAFGNVVDVGLTGFSPKIPVEDLRSKLNLTVSQERTVLLTFGGMGLSEVPYHHLQQFPDWQFITFDNAAPISPNLLQVPKEAFRPIDLMSVCGRVIGKPGYGTYAEVCRLQIPMVSLPRHDFAEATYLISGLQDYNHHQILEPGEFEQSWDFLHTPPKPPRNPQPLATNGNQQIASAVIDYLQTVNH